jgi:hypothetical protein
VHWLTFAAYHVIGISLTAQTRAITDLWEMARYEIQPRFLRIPGVARIALVGGSVSEYHVVLDPVKLDALEPLHEKGDVSDVEYGQATEGGYQSAAKVALPP